MYVTACARSKGSIVSISFTAISSKLLHVVLNADYPYLYLHDTNNSLLQPCLLRDPATPPSPGNQYSTTTGCSALLFLPPGAEEGITTDRDTTSGSQTKQYFYINVFVYL